MANVKMMAQMSAKDGFIAALDQSGGSTPGALRQYGMRTAHTAAMPRCSGSCMKCACAS